MKYDINPGTHFLQFIVYTMKYRLVVPKAK